MPFFSLENGRIISQKIEYNLVDHCNFSCDECSHSSPFMAKRSQSLEQFTTDLSRLAQVYRVQRFRFVGGEPLLHKKIVAFIRAVRKSELANVIEVVSNGVLMDRAPDELFQEVDSVSVSWYPDPNFSEDILDRARAKCHQFGARFRVNRINQFRQMQVNQPITDDKLVSDIFRSCQIAHTWNCQTFYDGKFYLCSRPLYTQSYQRRIGRDTEELQKIDGVPLHEPNLKARILEHMNQTHALASCKYCLGTVGRYQPWRQLSVAERRQPPVPESTPIDAIDNVRLRSILAWRAVEGRLLKMWPSTRLARALNVALTGILRH
ncbi:MAG: radical SAM protein [Woeseiaceae bacterium]